MGKFPLTPYFDSMIDDFGIWQHTDETSILHEHGYALDDANRGLLLTLALKRDKQSEVLFSYIQKSKLNHGFYGFADPKRNFIPNIASDDATGQVIWAAGYAVSKGFHIEEARQLVNNTLQFIDKTKYMRSFAYALLGLIYIDEKLASRYYKKLYSFFNNTEDDWLWPEQELTYGIAIVPYAFLRYGLVNKDKFAIQLGRKILEFIEKKCTHNRQRGPIGNEGWLARGSDVIPIYSQQPIDTAYMVWAWFVAYQISNDVSDLKLSQAWMRWFEGDNVAFTKMYDPEDMRCYDGIGSIGVSKNSGAESNICFLLSKYVLMNNITI